MYKTVYGTAQQGQEGVSSPVTSSIYLQYQLSIEQFHQQLNR